MGGEPTTFELGLQARTLLVELLRPGNGFFRENIRQKVDIEFISSVTVDEVGLDVRVKLVASGSNYYELCDALTTHNGSWSRRHTAEASLGVSPKNAAKDHQ